MTTYTFTLKAINSGTDGSSFGHVWFTVTPSDGSQSQTFGFYPDGMHQNDDSAHPRPDFFRSWELTQDQKDHLDQFILDYVARKEYLFPWEVCIDFAVAAAKAAEVDIRQHGDGPLFPGHFDDWIDEEGLPSLFDAEVGINAPYLLARNFVRRDPLAIDLDGDGIETVGVDAGVLFDHDGDGIKTGTGWVKGDDAFLVLDRNGNGAIDFGRELFGVDTIVGTEPLTGRTLYAADGFAALASIDGNGDKLLDANDTAHANLRLWRDTNQDGVSQSGELQSLSQAGITGIDLNAKTAAKNLGNGNTQTLTADVAGIAGEAAALDLADNPFYRQYTDTLDTGAVMDLPDMQGSGLVRDLKEAATQSTVLQGQLRALADQGYINRDAYLARVKALIDAWADTSTLKTSPGAQSVANDSAFRLAA